jgi:hypothetical protein
MDKPMPLPRLAAPQKILDAVAMRGFEMWNKVSDTFVTSILTLKVVKASPVGCRE